MVETSRTTHTLGKELLPPGWRPLSGTGAATASRRVIVLAGADKDLRHRLGQRLTGMRWAVHDAPGGAGAMAYLEELRPEALILLGGLPDLDVDEFLAWVKKLHPETDLLRMDGSPLESSPQSPRRHELLQVIREFSADVSPLEAEPTQRYSTPAEQEGSTSGDRSLHGAGISELGESSTTYRGELWQNAGAVTAQADRAKATAPGTDFLPEMVGTSELMKELGRLVRLVAPRSTTVLIEGETGTGKELVAKALHRLSDRANKPFMVLNCAAIPEALLEAELFGHTRGAFTGAVRSRIGRIEAADGGTMFLDEIGEMPLALQAKMLRFLECGELQKVGENEPSYVNARVIAATHQPLEQRAEERTFRLDLYHRLAVFPIEVPTLLSRIEDLPVLAQHFLAIEGRGGVVKQLSPDALIRLQEHHWPGNVRELMHVLERALILAGPNQMISAKDVRLRQRDRSPA